jgi:carbonic anhydrase
MKGIAMRRRGFICLACQAAAASIGVATTGAALAQPHPEFGYAGANGPSHWGGMSEHWRSCSAGVNQSPVELARFVEADLPALQISYGPSGREVVHTGHAIQVNAGPGSTLGVDGLSFRLLQFHFHAPSEHHLEGRDFPLEAHLVHQNQAGELAVIGVFFESGAPNDLLGLVTASLPSGPGQRRLLGSGLTPAGLLPADRDYLRYSGSLTTPPCSEGVRWLVMKRPMTASPAQIEAVGAALGFANNRPTQPLGARTLLR